MLWTQAWWDLTYPNGPTNIWPYNQYEPSEHWGARWDAVRRPPLNVNENDPFLDEMNKLLTGVTTNW